MMYQASKQKEESHHSPPMLGLAKVHPSYIAIMQIILYIHHHSSGYINNDQLYSCEQIHVAAIGFCDI